MSQHAPCKERRATGFALVELMVALLLGLLVVGGAVNVFIANQQSHRSNRALGYVQDATRVGFELMAREIREMGMTGCGNDTVVNATNSTAWWTNWTLPLFGTDDAASDTALSSLTGAGAPITGTSSLHLLAVTGTSASLSTQTSLVGAAIALNETGVTFSAGQILVVCAPDAALMGQLSAASAGSITFAAAGSGSPGNSATIATTFAVNSLVTPLNAAIWYIGANPVGGRSLYRRTLVSGALASQEMVRNVSGLTLTFHVTGASGYVNAASIQAASDWPNVDAVRVALTAASTAGQAATTDSVSRTFNTTIALRGRLD